MASDKTGVLKVGRTAYAIGILWSEIEDPTHARREAKEWAAQPMTLGDLCLVHEPGGQVGAGHKAVGHAKGMVSLAAALMMTRPGSWLAAFQTANGYWLVSTKGGSKVFQDSHFPDAKSLIDAISESLDAGMGRSEFAYIVAPANIAEAVGVDSYEATDLVAFASGIGKAKAAKLVDAASSGSLTKYLVVGLAVAGGVFGYIYYQQYLEEQRLEEERLRMMAANQGDKQIPPPPWEGKAHGSSVLVTCVGKMGETLAAFPGWDVDSVRCDEKGVYQSVSRLSLREGGGPVAWLKDTVTSAGLTANVSPAGDSAALVVYPMTVGETWDKTAADETKISDTQRYLQSSFEELFVPISFQSGGEDPYYATQTFSFDSEYGPEVFASILADVPGLTLQAVEYDQSKDIFLVTGAFYEKKPVPIGMDQ